MHCHQIVSKLASVRRLGHLWFPLLLVCLAFACSADSAFGFQTGDAGDNGTHGEVGDPGTDGTDGTDGGDLVIDEFPTDRNYIEIFGGSGGFGGNGGDGIDGDDDNFWAQGGNAGHGGHGGDATLSFDNELRTAAYVHGGRGGFGGMFGFGSDRDVHGMGGNGGDGGNASLDFIAARNGIASATGGTGGSAFGAGSVGGKGGTANVVAKFSNGNFWNSYLTVNQFGGRGGHGWQGADGGQGAVSRFGFGQSRIYSEADLSNRISWGLRVAGGTGGDSQNGTGGAGGTGRSSLSTISQTMNETTGVYYAVDMRVQGGSGGKSVATGSQSASGGRGAAAYFHAADTIQFGPNFYNSVIRLEATGGFGGSALGRRNSGNGGFGAAAGIVGEQAIESTSVDAPGSLSFRANGGHGGHAQGSGIAGNGGDAVYNDNFNVKNPGYGFFSSSVRGGNGGWGRNNGFGGDAIATSDEMFEAAEDVGVDYSLSHSMSAYGGHAGRGVAPARVAHGGDARITIKETDVRSTRLWGTAFAGQGNWGRSGDAIVDIDVETTSAEGRQADFHYAEGFGQANHNTNWNYRAAHGTNAVSNVNATSADGDARADSYSHGGWGYLSSGRGEATANATGAKEALAKARAFAFGDRFAETDNHALSHATAIGVDRAEASSIARTVGHGEYAQSAAFATAKIATAETLVSSKTDNWRTSSRLLLSSRTTSEESETIGTASTAASFRFLSDTAAVFQDATIEAHVQLMPESTSADMFVSDNSTFGDMFVDDRTADILGVGTIHGGMADGDTEGISVEADLSFGLETRDFFNDQRLMFGLMNLENEGNGFTTLDASLSFGSRMLFDESFGSGSEAVAFFDNLMIDLGSMPLDREFMEFDFDVSMTFDDSADQFGFGFVFGNANGVSNSGPSNFSAVPEPGSAAVLGIFAMFGLLRRRKTA